MFDEAAKFVFEIGQTVRHKSNPTMILVVTEQMLARCHGGIQRLYCCTSLVRDGVLRMFHNESELEVADRVDVLESAIDELSKHARQAYERAKEASNLTAKASQKE